MYQVESTSATTLQETKPSNYVIAPNDILKIDIYTGKGERLIDPNRQLTGNLPEQRTSEIQYYVQNDGTVLLPLIGAEKIAGLTLAQVSLLLKDRYTEFYNDPYVLVNFVNKRVVVLGAMGGTPQTNGKIIPLTNDQVTISEVIALAGGIPRDAKASNIRLIRDDQVKVIDLTTFESYKENNVVVLPGDIIYIEPIRRPVTEFFRENNAIFGLTTGIISLVSLIISLNK